MNKKNLIEELKFEGFPNLIIKAFDKVDRKKFVPEHLKKYAYYNEPLPIALGSTISQPYTIAFMLDLLELDKLNNSKTINDESYNNKNKIKILEIGSGSGYVLALINKILKIMKIRNYKIYGIERIHELVESSKKILKNKKSIGLKPEVFFKPQIWKNRPKGRGIEPNLSNKNITVIEGNGSKGLSQKAPFDRILVSAAYEKISEHLFSQLKENGILVTPIVNSIFQFKKIKGKIEKKEFPGFVFVPVIED